MIFEVCDVHRALASVACITAKGNRVVFGAAGEDDYILHVASGKKINMRKKGRAYVIDVAMAETGQAAEITVDSAAEE